jgi:mannose-6-phosphate isomerase-like protein (cupin superfamily)
MNIQPGLVVGFLAAVTACSRSSAVPPAQSAPTAPGGAAEVQGAGPGPGVSETTNAPRPPSFQTNILQAAGANEAYRRVLFTGARTQLVLMTIPIGGDIGVEAHSNVEQLLFVASGRGKAVVNGVESPVAGGDVVVVTPGTRHDLVSMGTEPLRIYTVYGPPNHIDGRVQQTKADANADTADEAFGRAVR